MSFLKKIVGQNPKKSKAPTLPEAIQRIKATEEILLKKQTFLEEKIKREISTAKKNASTNKKVALQALQRKKRYERQLQQVDGALTTLEAQRETAENANMNVLAVDSLKGASKAMKTIHKDIDVDKVDKIMDELADQREVAEGIAEAISQPVGFNDVDEDDLERELEELTQDLDELELEEVLPSVPNEKIKSEEKKKKKEILVAS